MKLEELLKQKIKTGQRGEFSVAEGKEGKVIIFITAKKKYVVQASLDNFQRFKDWIGKTADIDIKKTGKFHKTKDYGFLPTINIRIEGTGDSSADTTSNSTTNPEENPKKEDMVF